MTTIATDGITIAADTMRVAGSERIDVVTKKIIVEQKTVFAFTGVYGLFPAARAWYLAGHKPEAAPKAEKDSGWRLVVVTKAGLWNYTDSLPHGEPFPYPQAFGSGANYAMTAMRLGRSPQQAIAVARDMDVFTGGDIQVVDIAKALGLEPPKSPGSSGRRQFSEIDPETGKRKIRMEPA